MRLETARERAAIEKKAREDAIKSGSLLRAMTSLTAKPRARTLGLGENLC
jgi:hypothetical protein